MPRLLSKMCARCGGDYFAERDEFGRWTLTCFQCGHEWSGPLPELDGQPARGPRLRNNPRVKVR